MKPNRAVHKVWASYRVVSYYHIFPNDYFFAVLSLCKYRVIQINFTPEIEVLVEVCCFIDGILKIGRHSV